MPYSRSFAQHCFVTHIAIGQDFTMELGVCTNSTLCQVRQCHSFSQKERHNHQPAVCCVSYERNFRLSALLRTLPSLLLEDSQRHGRTLADNGQTSCCCYVSEQLEHSVICLLTVLTQFKFRDSLSSDNSTEHHTGTAQIPNATSESPVTPIAQRKPSPSFTF